jgi:hypothetical protein
MADDLELLFVQIGMNETVLRWIVDRHQPELAVDITSQNNSQSLPEGTGKYLSQISSPKFRTPRHENRQSALHRPTARGVLSK